MSAAKQTKPRRERDLSKAITLRPVEVFELYGIPQATLGDWCRHADDTERLPSILVQGKSGRKGVRLINHDELRAYLARHAA